MIVGDDHGPDNERARPHPLFQAIVGTSICISHFKKKKQMGPNVLCVEEMLQNHLGVKNSSPAEVKN